MIKSALEQLLPEKTITYVKKIRQNRIRAKVKSLPVLTEDMFRNILLNELGLRTGDVVFVHSSVNRLNLGFPFYRIITLIQQVTGDEGTLLFPTYPREPSSYKYFLSGEVFDIRKTPSYAGILTEFARKQKSAIRSFHPTKSVCAIGRYAQELTSTHQNSPFPYDSCSPYYKIIKYDGVIIGLGVTTKVLSFVHCVEDALKEEFPDQLYHEKLFEAKCVDYDGEVKTVKTYAHDLRKMNHNIPRYISKYVPEEICEDLKIDGMNFHRACARDLFDKMLDFAKKGITIYPKRLYKKRNK